MALADKSDRNSATCTCSCSLDFSFKKVKKENISVSLFCDAVKHSGMTDLGFKNMIAVIDNFV